MRRHFAALHLALVPLAFAQDPSGVLPDQARVEVFSGRVIVREDDGVTTSLRRGATVTVGGPAHVELSPGGEVRLSWLGRASLRLTGQACVQWTVRPQEGTESPSLSTFSTRGLDLRLFDVDRADLEVRRGEHLVRFPGGWVLEPRSGAYQVCGIPGGPLELLHHAGHPSRLNWVGDGQSARPPLWTRPGFAQRLDRLKPSAPPAVDTGSHEAWAESTWPWSDVRSSGLQGREGSPLGGGEVRVWVAPTDTAAGLDAPSGRDLILSEQEPWTRFPRFPLPWGGGPIEPFSEEDGVDTGSEGSPEDPAPGSDSASIPGPAELPGASDEPPSAGYPSAEDLLEEPFEGPIGSSAGETPDVHAPAPDVAPEASPEQGPEPVEPARGESQEPIGPTPMLEIVHPEITRTDRAPSGPGTPLPGPVTGDGQGRRELVPEVVEPPEPAPVLIDLEPVPERARTLDTRRASRPFEGLDRVGALWVEESRHVEVRVFPSGHHKVLVSPEAPRAYWIYGTERDYLLEPGAVILFREDGHVLLRHGEIEERPAGKN